MPFDQHPEDAGNRQARSNHRRIPYTEREIADCKASIPLLATLQRRVALKKRGNEWYGLCPFHQEKSPSFTINVEKGFYHCFGCGAHGTAIDAKMHFENMTFPEVMDEFLVRNGGAHRSSADVFAARQKRLHDEAAAARRAVEQAAEAVWNATVPAKGTVTEAAIRNLGYRLVIPPVIRHCPSLLLAGEKPEAAAVALVEQDDILAGRCVCVAPVHDGSSFDAGLVLSSETFIGEQEVGTIRLGRAGRTLGFAATLTTALAGRQLYSVPVWQCSFARRPFAPPVPDEVERILVFGEGSGDDFTIALANQFESYGRDVEVMLPGQQTFVEQMRG